ncbi:hypothetical protein JFL43_04435 [Viridibacillus sp. YIM B01967]|uniref:Uncharacterized protein n=1 Tax=Viridibacillus soli TaxID=2798301 RepID=A0ABS1H3Z3_9BACL|nr:hypothetical protein [Viridibacillus soli]MBK3494116.1 hypothetical protein [Viridibacillus soli]
MNVTEFIAALVDDLIWPIVIILAIVLFRKQISSILMNLTKFSFNDIELDFGEKIDHLEKELGHPNVTENDPSVKEHQDGEILTMAKISPSKSISMTWGKVENELRSTINRLGPNFPTSELTHSHKDIQLLKENNLINVETFTTFNELRNMKNQISNGKFIEKELTYTDAKKYYDLSFKIIIIFNDTNVTVVLPNSNRH